MPLRDIYLIFRNAYENVANIKKGKKHLNLQDYIHLT